MVCVDLQLEVMAHDVCGPAVWLWVSLATGVLGTKARPGPLGFLGQLNAIVVI